MRQWGGTAVRGRRALWAMGTLVVMAAASWLPVGAAEHPAPAVPDLARPALLPPATIPAHPDTPVQTVSAFFWQIGLALHAEPDTATAGPAADGAEGSATAPDQAPAEFARAYALLAPGWRDRQPFARFGADWSVLRSLDLLAVVSAGSPPGSPNEARVFVEVRTLTRAGAQCAASCLGFASGVYTVAVSSGGWQLTAGSLEAEDLAARPAPAPAVAEAAAQAWAAQRGRGPAPGARRAVRLGTEEGHQVQAQVTLGTTTYIVHLYQLVDGSWVAVNVRQ